MLLYEIVAPGRRRLVALLGVGLLGSAIAQEIERRARLSGEALVRESLRLRWRSDSNQRLDLEALRREIARRRAQPGDAPALDLVWSAGRAGFGSSEPALHEEVESLRRVLEVLHDLGGGGLGIHLLSSAGGLFEGQRCVGPLSPVAPMRPYGRSKQAQEALVEAADFVARRRIYRVASVYGPARSGCRVGLPAVLLKNGLLGRVTPIHGTLSTLRDYVWVGDVARRLVSRMLVADSAEALSVELLASARPTTLFEVKRTIEGVVGRRLYVSCSLEPSNAAHITFQRAACPRDWSPTPLRTGVERLHREAIRRGVGAAVVAGTRP